MPSRKKPRWLLPLPEGNQRASEFNLYKPFSPAARLMKSVIVRMRAHGWQGLGSQTVQIASRQPLALERLVSEITGEERLHLCAGSGHAWNVSEVDCASEPPGWPHSRIFQNAHHQRRR